jgi:hypothetical protein
MRAARGFSASSTYGRARSRRDPRVRAFHESADELLVELEAEGADYC